MLDRTVANLPAAIDASGVRITHTGLPEIMADPSLEQVFQNLISNAIKYGRDGVPTEIDVSARSDGDAWVFAVRDNGIGIDPLQMGNVFRIFRRLHGREIPGNGIGLALSKRIVEAHGGSIWVESAPNLHAASGKGGAAPEPAPGPALHCKDEPRLGSAEADLLDAHLTIRAVYVTHYSGIEPGVALFHFYGTFGLDFTLADDRLVVVNLDLVLAGLQFSGSHQRRLKQIHRVGACAGYGQTGHQE
jgi:signal transduction histidine kinase